MRAFTKKIQTLFLIGLFVSSVFSQKHLGSSQKDLPNELIILSSDPDCPIMLSSVINGEGTSTSRTMGYRIKNVSNSNIKAFLVQEVSWFGNGGYRILFEIKQGEVFSPGMSMSTRGDSEGPQISSITNSNANDRVKGSKPYKRLWVAIVTYVVFTDGRKYDASSHVRSLEHFIDGLDVTTMTTESDARAKEQRLAEFVELKLFSKPGESFPRSQP